MHPVMRAAPIAMIVLGLATIYAGGLWTWTFPIISFVLVPLLDQLSPGSTENPTASEEEARLADPTYDVLIVATLPLHLTMLSYGIWKVTHGMLSPAAAAGAIASMGLSCGVYGINVGHELGHRAGKGWQRLAWICLGSSLYLHFFVEHNRGHHRRVATPDDPASARRGETVYAFWVRSIYGSLVGAWELEATRLRNLGRSAWSVQNQTLMFFAAQAVAMALVGALAGPAALACWMVCALLGALLLETVNYLEHYGLARDRAAHGGWERVRPEHSWNSNRTAGRVLLYDLTRHSDHHAFATRPYPVLRHHDEAPELPAGYPAMILLSLVPPLFFAVMHARIDQWRARPLAASLA
jgi:alkane 1-monooxygenase